MQSFCVLGTTVANIVCLSSTFDASYVALSCAGGVVTERHFITYRCSLMAQEKGRVHVSLNIGAVCW